MIIKLLFELIISLLEIVFGWVSFPQMPDPVVYAAEKLLEYIDRGMRFVYLFVSPDFIRIVLPVILVVENFDKLYSVVMWVLKKIPFLGMK